LFAVGVSRRQIAFLGASRRVGVSYDRTLTIGRQHLWADDAMVMSSIAEAGGSVDQRTARAIVADGKGFAEPFFRYLGASTVDSLDVSDYEGCTIVHDLNDPLPDELVARYSSVVDIGTLEHIFDFPQAMKNCLDAVAVGGHYVCITPANNLFGHGFYQFSPELFYRILSPSNGFVVECMLLRADRRLARWYSIMDPAVVGDRVTLAGASPAYLYVVGRRLEQRQLFDVHPQQSDYTVNWVDPVRRLVPRVPRIPAIPLPVREASTWFLLLAGQATSSGLRPIKLKELVTD
jgi:hypothetical protein